MPVVPSHTCSLDSQLELKKIQTLTDLNFPMMDVYAEDLNNDGQPDFIVTTLGSHFEKVPFFIFLSKVEGSRVSYTRASVEGVSEAFHARHIHLLLEANQAYPDILIADHGPDHDPFPGAHAIWLHNQQGRSFRGEFFPSPPAFTFHVTPFSIQDKEFVFLNEISGKPPYSEIYERTATGFLPRPDVIQKTLSRPFCFMTSHAFTEGSQSYLALGACDRPAHAQVEPYDKLLSWTSDLEAPQIQDLPARNADPHWGTVAWASGDLKQNGHTDLVRATHNDGFTRAEVQVLIPTADHHFQSQIVFAEDQNEMDGFVPWVYIQGSRLIFSFRKIYHPNENTELKQRHFLLSWTANGFQDDSSCLPARTQKEDGLLLPWKSDLYWLSTNKDLYALIPRRVDSATLHYSH